jgi:hypothetical protein
VRHATIVTVSLSLRLQHHHLVDVGVVEVAKPAVTTHRQHRPHHTRTPRRA